MTARTETAPPFLLPSLPPLASRYSAPIAPNPSWLPNSAHCCERNLISISTLRSLLQSPRARAIDRTTMAAAVKALNAKIRANPVLDYVCSTRESSAPLMRL